IIPSDPAGEPFYIVLLHDAPLEAAPRDSKGSSVEIARLRDDLATTIEYGQSFVKEYESVNASLNAANEEILSTNEELQSTNEELETAKEELQTANDELSSRNRDLSQL